MKYFAMKSLLFAAAILAATSAYANLGTDQPTNVQCGDAARQVWTACPISSSPTATVGGLDTSAATGVSGAYVDFQWDTVNCSSSVVVTMRDTNYAPERTVAGDAGGADGCRPGYAKHHNVHVNYLSPSYKNLTSTSGVPMAAYTAPNHFFYVASQDQTAGTWSTNGGPVSASTGCSPHCPYGIVSPVPNSAGASSWAIWLYGAQNVYQGHDLLVAMQNVLTSGQGAGSSYMTWSSVTFTRQTDGNGNACVSNCTDVEDGTNFNLDVLFLCSTQYVNNAGSDYTNYGIDSAHSRDYCYYGNYIFNDGYNTLRIRTNCNSHGVLTTCGSRTTPPGRYQVAATFQPVSGSNTGTNIGNPITVTYTFTVLPSATYTATPPACLANSSCTPVPCWNSGSCGSHNWEDFVQKWGVVAATGGPVGRGVYGQDYLYSTGIFDSTIYNCLTAAACAVCWNYDGARTFWQISDYAAAHYWPVPAGAPTQPTTPSLSGGTLYPDGASYYAHAALTCQTGHAGFFGGVGSLNSWAGGALREWNVFPNGEAMTYWRTGDVVSQWAAITQGSWGQPGGGHGGDTLYQYYPVSFYAGGRATAYVLDSLVTAWQINGSIATNDQRQIQRLVDAILGEIDQQVNNDPYSNNYRSIAHPQTYSYGIINRSYMLGLSMEALIEYYEWQGVAGQQQDQRIPIAIRSMLDYMWANMWAANSSGYQAFYYNGIDIPHNAQNSNDNYPELNDLVCSAYAWYWKMSGDSHYQSEGDACFQSGIGAVAESHIWFTGKDFNQIIKWTPDYYGFRTTNNYAPATFPSRNPPMGTLPPDTIPPMPRPIALGSTTADAYTGVVPVQVNRTTVTINWTTFEPLTSAQVLYGLTNSYGSTATGTSINCGNISSCTLACNATVGTTGKAVCSNVYFNTVTLSGLNPNTRYHFAVKGTDLAGNIAQSNQPGKTTNDTTFLTTN